MQEPLAATDSILLLEAFIFARNKHFGQVRRGGSRPYIAHPVGVSRILSQFKHLPHLTELRAAGLLHDVLEDTNATEKDLRARFPSQVVSWVLEVTSNPKEVRRIGKFEYIKTRMCHYSDNALLLKLSDRLDNVSDLRTPKMVEDTLRTMYYVGSVRKFTAAQGLLAQKIVDVCQGRLDSAGAGDRAADG